MQRRCIRDQRFIHQPSVTGGILLNTKNDAILSHAIPGRFAWVTMKLQAIRNKENSSFDFAKYCRRNKITHQAYLADPSQIDYIDTLDRSVPGKLYAIQQFIRKTLQHSWRDAGKSGLAIALFIGQKDGVDPTIKDHYTRTGTIHIIAISGLHILLVFEIGWRLLYPLLFLRGGRILRTAITLLFVWAFCFLAGGEASVLRAGIMFTVMQLGRWLERPVTG